MISRWPVLTVFGVLAVSLPSLAQSSAALPPGMHGGPRPHDPVRELTHLTQALDLTAEQQTQIKPILEDRDTQMQTLHENSSLSRQESMAKAKGILDQSDSAIEAVLNSEQKAKFEKQRAMHAQMTHRHDNTWRPDGTPEPDGAGPPGGDGPPPDGPPGI
jgi:Spy/CpxP family protein refolding chaperone